MINTPVKPTKPIKQNQFRIIPTESGQWRVFEHADGTKFKEFRSDVEILGRPLLSIVIGNEPKTKKMATARGVVAIGQRASGIIAIGQFANGYISVGQFATGRIAAVGQFTVAPLAIGQFSLGVAVLSQIGVAGWGLFQTGCVLFGGWGQVILDLSKYLL